jgi:hypothetical protein
VLSIKELKKAGFAKSGILHRADGVVSVAGEIPKQPGIYRFAVGPKIRCVGKAERSLRTRFTEYINGLRKAIPTRLVRKNILEIINKKGVVEIYTFIIEE